MVSVVILIGPPGSGKTTVGELLAARYGYRFEDREAALLRRYGSRGGFIKHKRRAIAGVHAEVYRQLTVQHPHPLVHESTALTERKFVNQLRAEQPSLMVHLTASIASCVHRVRERNPDRNFTNEPDTTRLVWHLFMEHVGSLEFDLVLDTEGLSASDCADAVHAAVR